MNLTSDITIFYDNVCLSFFHFANRSQPTSHPHVSSKVVSFSRTASCRFFGLASRARTGDQFSYTFGWVLSCSEGPVHPYMAVSFSKYQQDIQLQRTRAQQSQSLARTTVLNQEQFGPPPPGDMWQYLEIFSVVPMEGWGERAVGAPLASSGQRPGLLNILQWTGQRHNKELPSPGDQQCRGWETHVQILAISIIRHCINKISTYSGGGSKSLNQE